MEVLSCGRVIFVLSTCTVSVHVRCSTLRGGKRLRFIQWYKRARSVRCKRRVALRQMRAGPSTFSFRCNNKAMTMASCGTVNAGVHFFSPPGFLHQEPRGDQSQRLVMMPALPGPHLVVGQTRLARGPLQALLDPMLGLECPGELRQGRVQRRTPGRSRRGGRQTGPGRGAGTCR